MSEVRLPSMQPGRRSGDSLSKFGKVIGIILSTVAALGFTGQVWLKGAQIDSNRNDIIGLTARVVVLEQQNHDMFYMTCVMFQQTKPNDVPASCNLALRK